MSEEAQDDASGKGASPGELAPSDCVPHYAEPTALSQSNTAQMTDSATPAESSKWCCEICTYENFPLSRKCTMCRSPKPLLGEDIFKLQDGASALPTQDICGAEAVMERLKPLRISSPQGQASASSIVKWPCSTCTYENWPKSQKCAMCGAPPPAPASPSAGAPPAHPARNTGMTSMSNNQGASPQPAEAEGGARRCARNKRPTTNTDWLWLQACLGVVEGCGERVRAYLSAGGDAARALTAHEVHLLNRASAFDAGHTLVHLAIRFQRQEILSTLLSRISGGGSGLKRSPSYIAGEVAGAIRRHVASCVRQKKGAFPCRYINEFCTFTLPTEIDELPGAIQEQLVCELVDREVQQTLEAHPPRINWSPDLAARYGCRLVALWNRSAGDCLPDAVCQAAYGVADRLNVLRAALADSMHHAQRSFYERWQSWERIQASVLHYTPEETQLRSEWSRLVAAAARPGTPLHQVHVFVLAHVLRRPILVYGVDVVNSFRGEALGYARFQGIYLPLLWEPQFCSKAPLCVGYTRGHFSALVPHHQHLHHHHQHQHRDDYICREQEEEDEEVMYLPLTDSEGKLLPVHFLNCDELVVSERVVRRWVCAREACGVLCARAPLPRPPLLQAQLREEWLNHYRRVAQQARGPLPPRLHTTAEFSSDPDTDEE